MKRDLLPALPCALAFALAAAGCASGGGAPVEPVVAPTWHAPLPHDGDVAELRRWWTQFDDPVLARLVDAAQAASPTIASAAARIEDARARSAAAGAALLPSLGATASAGRARQDVTLPVGTSAGVGLQASWEIDVFGRNRAYIERVLPHISDLLKTDLDQVVGGAQVVIIGKRSEAADKVRSQVRADQRVIDLTRGEQGQPLRAAGVLAS